MLPEVTTAPAGLASAFPDVPGGIVLLNVAGVVCLLLGAYFLIVNPGTTVWNPLVRASTTVVNFQRLALGATLMTMSSVFLASAWRPR